MNSSSSSNTINIGLLMREYALDEYRVSPAAVHELVGRVEMWLEMNMPGLCGVAKGHGRCTVGESDVVEFFSKKEINLLDE